MMKSDDHDEDNCPHCDVMGIFFAYGERNWEPQDIIEQVFNGLVSLVATAPDDLRKNMTLYISEHIGGCVEEARADMTSHNIIHRMH